MSNITLIIVIVIAIVVVVAIAVVGYQMARKRRTAQLREQYGAEYDRSVDQAENQREAESELRDRAKRHEKLELRSLDSSERDDFEQRWSDVQGQFVDDPSNAVRNAEPGGVARRARGARGVGADWSLRTYFAAVCPPQPRAAPSP